MFQDTAHHGRFKAIAVYGTTPSVDPRKMPYIMFRVKHFCVCVCVDAPALVGTPKFICALRPKVY